MIICWRCSACRASWRRSSVRLSLLSTSAKQNDHHVSSLDKGTEEIPRSDGGEESAHASDRTGDIQNGGCRFS